MKDSNKSEIKKQSQEILKTKESVQKSQLSVTKDDLSKQKIQNLLIQGESQQILNTQENLLDKQQQKQQQPGSRLLTEQKNINIQEPINKIQNNDQRIDYYGKKHGLLEKLQTILKIYSQIYKNVDSWDDLKMRNINLEQFDKSALEIENFLALSLDHSKIFEVDLNFVLQKKVKKKQEISKEAAMLQSQVNFQEFKDKESIEKLFKSVLIPNIKSIQTFQKMKNAYSHEITEITPGIIFKGNPNVGNQWLVSTKAFGSDQSHIIQFRINKMESSYLHTLHGYKEHLYCGFVKDSKNWEKNVPFNENGTFKDIFEDGIQESQMMTEGSDKQKSMKDYLKNDSIISFNINLIDGVLKVFCEDRKVQYYVTKKQEEIKANKWRCVIGFFQSLHTIRIL